MTSNGANLVDAALDGCAWLHGRSRGPWPAEVQLDEVGVVDFGALVEPEDEATLREVVAAILTSGRAVTVEYRRAGDVARWMLEELRPTSSGYATVVRRARADALSDSTYRALLAVAEHDLANLRFLLNATADAAKLGAWNDDMTGDLAHVLDRAGEVASALMVAAGGSVAPSQAQLSEVLADLTRVGRRLFDDRELIVTTTGPRVTRQLERPRLLTLLTALLARGLRQPRATEDVRVNLRTEAPDWFELSIEHPSAAPFEPEGVLSERSVITHASTLGLVLRLTRSGATLLSR
jgi:hypothetical protein